MWEIGVMAGRSRYSPEVRERAVRMVTEHVGERSSLWAAIESIAAKIGCSAETLREWVVLTPKEIQHIGLGEIRFTDHRK